MRWSVIPVMILLPLVITTGMMGRAFAETVIYRVVDEPGIDIPEFQQPVPNEQVKELINILEAWMVVSDGTVDSYIKLNTTISPLTDDPSFPYDYRFIVEAMLKSGDELVNLTAELASGGGGPEVVACALTSSEGKTENFGSVELDSLNPIILKLSCSFPGMSFSKPDPEDQEFKVLASVVSASIDSPGEWFDTVALTTSGGTSAPQTPPEEGRESQPEGGEVGGGNQFNPILIIAGVIVAVAVIAIIIRTYFIGKT